ncbi:MAG: hypothetical protein WAQ24_00375 [Candidatus Saccharimonadales bacterium]
MKRKFLQNSLPVFVLGLLILLGAVGHVYAIGSPEPQQSGTTGLQGKISSPAPTTPPTIATPGGGSNTTGTATITGLCTNGLLVKIFSNNIFVGSVQCVNGSYSVQISLFGGQNDIVARVYDALDQAGPDSNRVSVSFQDPQFASFGERISLTSTLAKLGAPVGSILSWPIVLSGGTGPYAISVDWGDGTATDLKSQPFAGTFELTHTYKSAGIYRVVVKATDSTGATAFLQLVGVGSGQVTQSATGSNNKNGSNTTVKYVYIWWPLLLMVPIIMATFWLGKRYELAAIHKQIEQQSQLYNSEIQR